jgi:hypothetical protein
MRLTDTKPTIETSGNLEEQFFSIQDTGMIFDILRNKMYSNPILAICREISCNARDAHREVGKTDVPIIIHLPNRLELFYKIKDFGPGISPDRMSNIFIKYTASTKRDDNVQTGGFGLGAKTPFSYSDTFTILTNFEGVQYNYACFIDETKVGKLILLSSEPTTEGNGTEIIIPVKPADCKTFAEWTEQATRHWDVKPTFQGGSLTYQSVSKIIDGKNWMIGQSASSWQREIKLIIDGIEYPLEISALKTYADSKMIDASRGNIYLYFDVGELSLSASREQVYLDKPTQHKIRMRLEKMAIEIKANITTKIDSFENLWLANVYYRSELKSAFNNITFLGRLFWKGIELNFNSSLDVKCPTFFFGKGKYSKRYGTDPNKVSRSTGNSCIVFEANSELFINDLSLKEPTARHVKKAFEQNPSLQLIQVICLTDTVTEATLNTSINLNLMKPRRLSEITKASSRAYTAPSSRLMVFQLDSYNYKFKHTSYSSIEEDENDDKVLCILSKESNGNSRYVQLKSGKILSTSALKTLCRTFTDVSFYGIDRSVPADRVKEEFSDFIDIDTFIKDKVISSSTVNFVEIKFAKNQLTHIDESQLRYIEQFKKLITKSNSLFIERLSLHEHFKKISETDSGMLDIYEFVNGSIQSDVLENFAKNNPKKNAFDIHEKYVKKYPLIPYINVYRYHEIIDSVAQYVNLVDAV